MMILVTIPGEPVGQGRPRAAVIAGKPRIYSPKASSEWRAKASYYMREQAKAYTTSPYAGPVSVEIEAVFTLPKSKCRKKNPVTERTACTKKPDFDNIAKAVCDAANGILFVDDSQVFECLIVKLYGRQDEAPFVRVKVFEGDR